MMAGQRPRASGDDIRIYDPPRDGSLVINGGSTGIAFQITELTGGAEKFDDLAAELEQVQWAVGRVLQDLCAVERLPPWSGVQAVLAVREGEHGVGQVAADMRSISARIRDCIIEYEVAEQFAGYCRYLGLVTPAEFRERWSHFAATGVPDRDTVEDAVAQLDTDQQPGGHGREQQDSALDQAVEGAAQPLVSRPVAALRAETVPVQLDTDVAGLLARIRSIDARGPGYLEVIEVDNAGSSGYVVVVPGTQAGDIRGTNPFDALGIAEAMTYDSEYVTGAVLAALKEAGAKEGAPVVAVGYSQGGIHAMNFAADPRVLKEYDVRYVLTAGSPVGGIDPGAGVSSMHLEHEADGVPGGDGRPNPDTLERVTVTLTNDVSDLDKGLLGPGHSLANYEEGARLAAASREPALLASNAVLTGALGAGGAATATRFALTRTAPQPPVQFGSRGNGAFRPFSPEVHRSDVSGAQPPATGQRPGKPG